MSKRSLFKSAEVEIKSLTKKGNGLGVTTGDEAKEVEVPFAIPGDKVRALLMRKRGGVYASRLEEVITPSPLRISPRCVHFGVCGGCRFQQMPYTEQLNIKQREIETLFAPLFDPYTTMNPIISCEPPWQYRNKMEFTFSSDAAGGKYAGLIMDGSRGKVLNLTECHLTSSWFIDALTAARNWWKEYQLEAYHPHYNKGQLRQLTVREGIRSSDRAVMLTVSGNPGDALTQNQLDAFVAFIREAIEPENGVGNLSIMLRIQQAVKGKETSFFEILLYGPDTIREDLNVQVYEDGAPIKLNFTVSPSAFFQPNTRQAERLYSLGLQLLELPKNSVVYDLYCGTGTLGICAAKYVKTVIGIEISEESSLDARTNAAANGLKNVTILTGSARDVIKMIRDEGSYPLPDVVMVDPPRAGLDGETVQHLIDLKPDKILYISCNPATQAVNIADLMRAGYRLAALQPVDQFPQTAHVENIAILKSST
jgi:23S rRNA (uracil1939-C5)-methyltransferase